MSKTGIRVNTIKKVMNISVTGKMEKTDAKIFLDDYLAKTKAINASEFTLEVDCSSMQVLAYTSHQVFNMLYFKLNQTMS